MPNLIRERVKESVAVKQALLTDDALLADTARAAEILTDALRSGGKAIFFGNGGSAADATHLAAELVGRFCMERPPLPALSLTDNGSSMSAIGNDFSYAETFARQVCALGAAGDVAVGLSTSGMSPNVVRGLRAAAERGLRTIAFTGLTGGECVGVVELCLRMPSTSTARIQECYMLLCHAVCEQVERALFAPARTP